jgi:hypothetical protein
MKQQLTIHMIVKNNESTIEDCISSFESINFILTNRNTTKKEQIENDLNKSISSDSEMSDDD